jgi:nucleotidyltransferase/DNA polymerase involved in DNA repair
MPYAKNSKKLPFSSSSALRDLVSVGPKTVLDFQSLGIRNIAQLARSKPETLYRRLYNLRGQRIDPCCLDVFSAAVAQARNPRLPAEQRVWWYWSRQRKAKATAK